MDDLSIRTRRVVEEMKLADELALRSASIGFVGAGRMAEALARSLIHAGVCTPDALCAYDPDLSRREVFAHLGVRIAANNHEVAERASIVIIAVKPAIVPSVLQEIAPAIINEQIIVSIAAGVSVVQLEKHLPDRARVVRVMPNVACQVGAMAAAFCRGHAASAEDAARVKALLDAVGRCYEVPEDLMDAVTGLSGSGPAYIFTVIEALTDGGVKMGLPREVALGLAAQTVVGAAQMVLQLGRHPAELRDAVTSPGGTTIEGLHVLERSGIRQAFISAVEAAALKAKALFEKFRS